MTDTDNSLLVPISMEIYKDETADSIEGNDFVYCSICNINFFDSDEFKRHNVEIHAPSSSNSATGETTDATNKRYQCIHCTSKFSRHNHLKRHINSVHSIGIKSHKCPLCEEDFFRRDVLLKHMNKSHSGASSFKCRECPFDCVSLKDLETHNKTHTHEDAHVCSYCKKPFKRRDHMLRHIKTLHLNQYTVCPICCKHFKRKDHLVRHCREKHRVEFQKGKIVKLQYGTKI